jgi:DNA-binding response OmpR family regulator
LQAQYRIREGIAAVPTSKGIRETGFRPGQGVALVLVVVPEPVLAEAVRLALDRGPYLARAVRDACEAAALLVELQPHLAVIDMDVDDGDVLDHLWAVPTSIDRIPVIALTRRVDLQTKLKAFQRGVDDVLTVPCSAEELVARTLAVIRRAYRDSIAFTSMVQMGDLQIDMLRRRVRGGDDELHLTPLEHQILYLLAANAGRLVTREQILDSLRAEDYVARSNVVDRHICNLRAKLRQAWERPPIIATIPGHGYRLCQNTQHSPASLGFRERWS